MVPNTSHSDRVGTIVSYSADGGAMPIPPAHRQQLECVHPLLHRRATHGMQQHFDGGRGVRRRAGQMTALRKVTFGLELSDDEAMELRPAVEAAEAWISRRTGGHSN